VSRVPKSQELYARALQLIPGGTQLVSRRQSRYAAGVSPAYAARAKGARIWDVDGHEYIDWVSGIGAIILNNAVIGKNCLIGAHTLISERKVIPDNSLVMGSPGKVVRELDATAIARLRLATSLLLHQLVPRKDRVFRDRRLRSDRFRSRTALRSTTWLLVMLFQLLPGGGSESL